MNFYSKNLREVYGDTLVELGESDPRIVVLDADLNTSTCTDRFKAHFPDRFVQCGIAEANMFSIAAGMAYQGYITFPSTFAAFSTRKALDPLFLNICCQQLNVKIPGSYPGLTATECGPSHNVCDDVAAIRALPYIKVADAGDNRELASMMHTIVREDGPVYFRIPKAEMPELFGDDYRFVWGRGYELLSGKDVAIASTGMMTGIALKAAELLREEGYAATVLHLPSIKPIDDDLLSTAARRCGCILTLENGRTAGGFGGAVAESVGRSFPVALAFMGVPDEPAASCDLGALLRHYALTPRGVQQQAIALIGKK